MKKIISSSLLVAALAVGFTGCLKDKQFEDHLYGITDPGTQPPGVGFPLAAKAKNTVGLNAGATAVQAVNDVVYVNLESGKAASSPVNVTLQANDALRTAYNTANGTSIQALPANLYTLAPTITIPAGDRNAQIPVNVSNTTSLDPNKSYGIGVTIASVDGGYTVASNLKNLLIEFTVKNKYHGTYKSVGYIYHPSAPRAVDQVDDVLTAGANSVTIPFGDLGTAGYVGLITVDQATNKLTIGSAPGAPAFTQMDAGLPTTSPGYTPQWAGSAECDNTYDPATKTFKLRYGYVGGTGWRVIEEKTTRQ